MNPQPNIIKKYSNGDNIAIFDYTKGLMYATKHSLKCINGKEKELNYNNYIIINGEIHIKITSKEFPLIKRQFVLSKY